MDQTVSDTAANTARYARQTVLPEIGQIGQQRLAAGRVLCIGAGGLGCPALQYMAAAGVGHIGIVDHDDVDLSNLQRQILFTEDQIGTNKAKAARDQLCRRNSSIDITAYPYALTPDNCEDLFAAYDVVIDATDNFAAKFLINDAAVKTKTPWVYGSILGFKGQMAAFDPRRVDAPCYRCLFPHPPQEQIMNCAQAGVIGAVAGTIGTMQALEVIKILVQNVEIQPLFDRLLQIDIADFKKALTSLVKEPTCKACSGNTEDLQIKEEAMYSRPCTTQSDLEISPAQAKALLVDNKDLQLIDVREIHEWEAGHIEGADHCPLSLLLQGLRPDNLKKDAPIILYCKGGVRSMQALHILHAQGYADIKSMRGGYDMWMMMDTPRAA